MNNPLQLAMVNFNKGAYIIVEGKQKADYFYIIRSGRVRISKEVEIVEEEVVENKAAETIEIEVDKIEVGVDKPSIAVFKSLNLLID